MAAATRSAFVAGWYRGALLGEATPREIATEHPEYSIAEVDAFGQGSVDGAAGDAWRRDRIPDGGTA
ncbi:MAG TPA: hypothetical protein VGX21_03235 [Methylomirabilota bacterium]|jgi:hypothetical protein|nr:hypothetical protein [Methylomirabilota bacterium]